MRNTQQDLERNARAVATYVAATAVLLTLLRANRAVTLGLVERYPDQTPFFNAHLFLSMLAAISLLSALQSVCFAKIGAAMDSPLWRLSSSRTALRTFFPLWLVINLFTTTVLSLLGASANGSPQNAAILSIAALFAVAAATPAGVAVMFHSATGDAPVTEAAVCLLRNLSRVAPAMLLGILQWVSGGLFEAALPPHSPLNLLLLGFCDIPLALAECVIMVISWRVCMESRDRAAEEDNAFDDDDY